MNQLKGCITVSDLQKKLSRYHFGYEREGDLFIFRTAQMGMPNCFLRGLIVDKNLKVICAPFCTTTTLRHDDAYAQSVRKNATMKLEYIPGVIVRLYHYQGEWRYATKFHTNFHKCADGTLFTDIVRECLGREMPLETLDRNLTYVLNVRHSKVITPSDNTIKPEVVHITSYINQSMIEDFDTNITGIRRPGNVEHSSEESVIYRVRKPDNNLYVVIKSEKDRYAQLGTDEASMFHIVTTGKTKEYLRYFPENKNLIDAMHHKIDTLMDTLVPHMDEYKSANPPSISPAIDRVMKRACQSRQPTNDLALAEAIRDSLYSDFYTIIEPTVKDSPQTSSEETK